jgi:hypothetical protein
MHKHKERKLFISCWAHPARAPPKIGKTMIFWRKMVIFPTKNPKNIVPPSARKANELHKKAK